MEEETFFITLIISLLLSFLLIRLVFLPSTKTKTRNNHQLPLPPSPHSLPLIGHLHLISTPLHLALFRLASHGQILLLRFGIRNVLLISSSSAADDCLSKNDQVFASRPILPPARHLTYDYHGLGAASYGPLWHNLRRIATVDVLSTHRVISASNARAKGVASMVRRLYNDVKDFNSGMQVALRPRLQAVAMDAMMWMVSSETYGGGDEEARKFREIMDEMVVLFGAWNVGDFLPMLKWVDRLRMEEQTLRWRRKMDEFLDRLIDESRRMRRNGGEKEEKNLIDVMLSLQETEPLCSNEQNIKGLILVIKHCSLSDLSL